MEKKLRVQSRSWLTSVFTVLMGIITAQGIHVPPDAPEQVADAIMSGRTWAILVIIGPNLLTPVFKLVEKIQLKEFSWNFLTDTNFWIPIFAAIGIGLEVAQVIPMNAGVSAAVALHAGNSGNHFYKQYKAA